MSFGAVVIFLIIMSLFSSPKNKPRRTNSVLEQFIAIAFIIILSVLFGIVLIHEGNRNGEVIKSLIGFLLLIAVPSFSIYKVFHDYFRLKIVLNSRDDLNPKILQHIIDNRVSRLYINFQFRYLDDNPFHYVADQIKSVKFEIILSNEVTDLSCLFLDCVNLTEVRPFDTSSVVNMTSMFQNCHALIHAPELDMSRVTVADRMFSGCGSLETVPLYHTVSLSGCRNMFDYCVKLKKLPKFSTDLLSHYSLEELRNSIRYYCFANLDDQSRIDWQLIESIVLNGPEDLTDENLSRIRYNQIELLQINYKCTRAPMDGESPANFAGWMRRNNPFFRLGAALTRIDFRICFSRKITSVSHLFSGCSQLTSVKSIETDRIKDFSCMFGAMHDPDSLFGYVGCRSLTSIPQKFNTSSGENFRGMFSMCSGLKTVPELNLSHARDLSYMFAGCSSLGYISQIEIRSNADLTAMFADCSSLVYKPVIKGDGSQITDSIYAGTRFEEEKGTEH